METDIKISKMEQKEVSTPKADKETYKVVGRNASGSIQVTIEQDKAFEALKCDSILTVITKNSQKTLEEFDTEKERAEHGIEDE